MSRVLESAAARSQTITSDYLEGHVEPVRTPKAPTQSSALHDRITRHHAKGRQSSRVGIAVVNLISVRRNQNLHGVDYALYRFANPRSSRRKFEKYG
jgi:hypothetical protein